MRRVFASNFSICGMAFIASVALSATLWQQPVGAEDSKDESKKESKKDSRQHFAGLADYYHHSLYGKRTASGQVLKKDLLTAAHRTLPFGTRVHVLNKRTGKSCIVVINDRGPYTKSKVIDLSHAAADKLGLLQAGTGSVACTVLADNDE